MSDLVVREATLSTQDGEFVFTPGTKNTLQQVLTQMGATMCMPAEPMRFTGVAFDFEFKVARALLINEIQKDKPSMATIERAIRLIMFVATEGSKLQGVVASKDLLDLMQGITTSIQEHVQDKDTVAAIRQDMMSMSGKLVL